MGSSYDMAVRLSFSAGGLSSAAFGAITVFQALEAQAAKTSAAVAGMGSTFAGQAAAMERFQALMKKGFIAGGIVTGIGLVAAMAMKPGIDTAMQWRDAMAQVSLATGATGDKLKALRDIAISLSAPRLFSAKEVMTVETEAARSGINNPALLQRALPQLLNVAEVDALGPAKVPVKQSIDAAVALSHMFQVYPKTEADMPAFNHMLDTFSRAQMVSPLAPKQMVRALSYISPAARNYGMSPEEQITFAALGARAGLIGGSGAGGGAAGMASILYALSPNGAKHNTGMERIAALGGTTWGALDANQKDFMPNLLRTVMRAEASIQGPDAGAARMKLLTDAFGRTGARVLSPLTTDAIVGKGGQYDQVRKLLGNDPRQGALPSASQMQGILNATPGGQERSLASTRQNIGGLFGDQMLDPIMQVIHALNQATTAVQGFMLAHPALLRFAATFVMVGTAVALIVGPLMMIGAVLGLVGVALAPVIGLVTGLTLAMTGLDITMLPVTAVVLGLIAVVALVVTVWSNWGAITTAVGTALGRFGAMVAGLATGALGALHGSIEWLNTHLPIVSQFLVILAAPILVVIAAFTHWRQIIGVVGDALGVLRPLLTVFLTDMGAIGDAIKNVVGWIGHLVTAVEKLAAGPLAALGKTLGGFFAGLANVSIPGMPTLPTGGGGAIAPAVAPVAAVNLTPAPGMTAAHPFGPAAPAPMHMHMHTHMHTHTTHPFGPPAPAPMHTHMHTHTHTHTHTTHPFGPAAPAPMHMPAHTAHPFGPAAPAHMHTHMPAHTTTTQHTQHTQHVHPGAVTVNIHGAGGTPKQNADAAMAAAFAHLGAAANHELQHGTIKAHGASPRTRVPHAAP